MIKKVILFLLISIVPSIALAGTCPLNQNLVSGGSFENQNDLNKWNIINGSATPSFGKYSSGWAGNPPNGAGEAFLYAVVDKVTIEQTIDLSDCNFRDEYNYNFGAYLGGFGDGDTVRIQVIFKDKSGNDIDKYDTGEQTSDKQMNYFNKQGNLPQGITKAVIQISIKRNSGHDADGYADLVNFAISKPSPFKEEFIDFELINSPESRLIKGNFVIAGNTVTCLTNKTYGFGGTCQDAQAKYQTDNTRVVKYIDIDNDSRTWNSSSSYIELPINYAQKDDGSGIAWAGLFWQGTIGYTKSRPLRYAKKDGNSYKYIQTGRGTNVTWRNIDFKNTNADKILLKINNQDYTEVSADRVNYSRFSSVVTYAGFADITQLVRQAKLRKGKNVFQIANLVAGEGRESSTGNFGGWSIVVIYNEDLTGKIRSISSYYGFVNAYNNKPVKISGLRLPKRGEVSSKAALFSGEGEYLYGQNDLYHKKGFDWLKISNTKNDNYQFMPDSKGNPLPDNEDVGNRNNIFDAHLSGIKRDHFDNKFNDLQVNNNSVDIDVFDVSKIMEQYRNQNQDIDSIYLKANSNWDYIALSMLTFATELYAPKVCYDYALMDGNYTNIPDINRTFYKSANGKPLNVKVTLRSQETDFDLVNSKIHIDFTPKSFNYIPGSAKYTIPNTHIYDNAFEIDRDKGIIAVGSNPTSNGGTISANETIYTIQSYENSEDFNGTFDIALDTTINFDSSTSINYTLSLSRCPTNPTYDPIYWRFNVEKPNVTFNTKKDLRYSLPTQVAGKPYNISIASYKKSTDGSYNTPNKAKATIELEIINAGTFDNNSSSGFDTLCEEPSSISRGVFVKFKNQKRKIVKIPEDYPTYPSNIALKNATFRMWVLTKKVNGTVKIVNHNCKSQNSSRCFDDLYRQQYSSYDKNSYCKASCNNSSGQTCYKCLKKYFARPVCARDNFAIRPKSYSIDLSDNNQTNSNSKVFIKNNRQNQSGFADIAAGYLYRLDINATNFLSNSNVYGYYFQSNNHGSQSVLKFNDLLSCNDKSDKNINISIFDGTTIAHGSLDQNTTDYTNSLIVDNTGKYKLHIEDNEWTIVDQVGYQYKPFPNIQDCILNQSLVSQGNNLNGCKISSNTNGYSDINIYSHPYKFDFNVSLVNNKQAGSNFIYSSNLSSTAGNLKENVMAIKSNNRIAARGKNGVLLSNYTNQCSAKDLTIKYDFITKPNSIKNVADENLSIEYFSYVPNIDNDINVIHNFSKSNPLRFSKRYFDKNSTGTGIQNNYFNIQRSFNKPMNPFKITFNTVYLNTHEQMTVDLNQSYKPDTKRYLNKSFFVYYGRAASSIKFYDDVTEDNVNTPIEYQVFCDENLTYCKNMGIDIDNASTDEYNWWINTGHTFQSGRVGLTTDSNMSQISTNFTTRDFSNGIDKSMRVDALSNNRPYIVTVKPANNTINNTPWLLYNPNSNSAPSYLFRVRFVGSNDMWSGLGESGFSTDVNSTIGKKSKKIDW